MLVRIFICLIVIIVENGMMFVIFFYHVILLNEISDHHFIEYIASNEIHIARLGILIAGRNEYQNQIVVFGRRSFRVGGFLFFHLDSYFTH
jgi:hypothetical protein